jgi:type VI secretion system protein ImpM
MGMPFLRPPEQVSDFAVFGKLPHRADFVRVNATHPTVNELDERLAAGLASLADNADWEQRYDNMPAVVYACRDRTARNWMIGAWRASRDQAGRRFPLVGGVLRGVDEIEANAPLIPIAYEVFHDDLVVQIDNALDNSVEALSCQQYLQGYSADFNIHAIDFNLARAVLNQFADRTQATSLERGSESFLSNESLSQACLNIAFHADFLRRFPSENNQPIVIHLPGEPGQSALAAGAWLDLIERLSGGPGRIAGIFLTSGSRLYVCLDSVAEKMMPLLLGNVFSDDDALNLAQEQEVWRSHRFYSETAYALSRLLANPAASVAELLKFASHVGGRLAVSRQ